MKKQFKKLALISLVLVLAVVSSACGASTEAEVSSIFTLGHTYSIDTLNILSSNNMFNRELYLLLYDPLVRLDENQQPVPALAKGWSVSDDELKWTFELVDTKWHDGKPFTAEDVKFTYDLIQETGLSYSYGSYLSGITDVEVVDEHTVIVSTDEPKANMLMVATPIVPKHIWEELSREELEVWPNSTPIGTGPYKFDSQNQSYIKLMRNEEYYGENGKVDGFVFVEYANGDSMAQALRIGEIDGAVTLNPSSFEYLQKESELAVISGQLPGFYQVGINCWTDSSSNGSSLLLDKALRQAMEYGIDKDKIVNMAYNGCGEAATTIINSSDYYHYEPSASVLRSFNLEKGIELLEAAGYTDLNGDGIRESQAGEPLEFEFITIADNAEETKAGQIILSDMMELGIKLNHVTMDSGALQDKIDTGDYDMFIWGWGADVDPSDILKVLTTEQIGMNNETKFSNAEYDELFIKQQTMINVEERKAAVKRMQEIVYEEAPYLVYIYDENVQGIRSDKWQGFMQIPEAGTFFMNLSYYNYMHIEAK